MNDSKDPFVFVKGETFSLSSTQSSRFGVSDEDLKWIILAILKQSPSHKCVVKTLFQKVLSHLYKKPRGKAREELLQLFVLHLRKLKEQGKVKFISAKTKVHVSLL